MTLWKLFAIKSGQDPNSCYLPLEVSPLPLLLLAQEAVESGRDDPCMGDGVCIVGAREIGRAALRR